MARKKVLAMWRSLEQRHLEQIAATDAGIELIPALYRDRAVEAWLSSNPPVEAVRTVERWVENFPKHIGEAEIIYGQRLPDDVTALAPKLRWVHSYGAGIDPMPAPAMLAKGITITSSSPVNCPQIAEFCMLYMLMHAKHGTERVKDQEAKTWRQRGNSVLFGKTLGIVGPGRIGSNVARRAEAFDMRVLATRRTYVPGATTPHVAQVYPRERLNEMLGECDYVVVSTPLTAETRRLIGAAQFAAMKRGAYFMNVCRGAVVDERALTDALKSGQLGGAGLDVFEREPLPKESELWTLPNVFVTPHSSNGIADLTERSVEFFCLNLRRYLAGQPLEAVIDPIKGY